MPEEMLSYTGVSVQGGPMIGLLRRPLHKVHRSAPVNRLAPTRPRTRTRGTANFGNFRAGTA